MKGTMNSVKFLEEYGLYLFQSEDKVTRASSPNQESDIYDGSLLVVQAVFNS